MVTPVFIFLPVEGSDADPEGAFVDPVCHRKLVSGRVAGRLMHGGRYFYFCSLTCAERFASDPTEFDVR
jgi:YHS domain-containing protein